MKYTKLFTLAIAALFAGSAMADDYIPTSVFKVGTESTLGTKWADKGQPQNYFISGDTTIFSAFVCYQSCGDGKQEWTGKKGDVGSTSGTYNATLCFKGSSAWGTGQAGTKVTTFHSGRIALYNVTNCLSVLVYADLSGKDRKMYINAYEIAADGTVSTTVSASDTCTENGAKVTTLSGLDASKTYQIQVLTNTASNSKLYEVAFVAKPLAKNIATLSSISINGEPIANFDPETLNYTVELPYGTKDYPTVTAVCTSPKAHYFAGAVVKTGTYNFPAKQVINVTAEDGSTTKQYELTYTVNEEASHDASVSSITLKGLTINNPKPDTTYSLTYDYLTTIPTKEDLKVTFNDENAKVDAIDNCVEWGKIYSFSTVAQDNTTKNTYNIRLYCNSAPKLLYEVVFSNGAKGAINEADTVITVPYLAGEAVPTTTVADIKTDSLKIGENYYHCTAAIDAEGNIIVTGDDNTTLKYPVKGYELTAPTTLGTDTVKFDGTEISYIYGAYGYDASKGWKFAKKVNEAANRRISKGTTRLYMVLPAADSLTLISGTGDERAIKLYVNGVENTEVTKTAKSGEGMKFKLDATKTNFICIESNQKSGDGGFTALILTPAKTTPSAIDNASSEVKAVKVIRNGQLYILKGDKIYNALGSVVE